VYIIYVFLNKLSWTNTSFKVHMWWDYLIILNTLNFLNCLFELLGFYLCNIWNLSFELVSFSCVWYYSSSRSMGDRNHNDIPNQLCQLFSQIVLICLNGHSKLTWNSMTLNSIYDLCNFENIMKVFSVKVGVNCIIFMHSMTKCKIISKAYFISKSHWK